MLQAAIVTTEEELIQIYRLNQENLKSNVNVATQKTEGFVTWLYPLQLLEQMHQLSPSVIVKDGTAVAGYALTTLKESSSFHSDLQMMFRNLEKVQYKDKSLSHYQFYCMGQICVAKNYRGKGVVEMLYQKHKEVYGPYYDFLLTEVSTSNPRSLKAHQKIGFQTIYTYSDAMDEWNVIIWDWN